MEATAVMRSLKLEGVVTRGLLWRCVVACSQMVSGFKGSDLLDNMSRSSRWACAEGFGLANR